MKKRLLAVAMLLCLLLPSLAMGEEEAPTLLFSWWGDAEVNEATQTAVDLFMRSIRRRVVFESHTSETRDAHEDWLTARWDAGMWGDIVELDAEMLRTLAKQDGQLRLMDVEAFPDLLDLSQFSYLGLVGCAVDGQLCAVPISVSSHVFFWSNDALEERKQTPPEGEAELLALAQALRMENGPYPLAASAESRIALMVTYLQSRYGAPWINHKERAVGFTVEQVAEGFAYLGRMEKSRVWPKLSQQGDLVEGWQQGKFLGVWAWDTMAAELGASSQRKGKLGIVTQLSEWSPYAGGFQKVVRMLAIPQGAKMPEQSAKLIQYLLSGERGTRTLGGTRGIPDSERGAIYCRRFRLVDTVIASINRTALSWARYPMPDGFEAPGLVGAGGVYEQVLLDHSEGLLTDEAAAAALMLGIKAALQ